MEERYRHMRFARCVFWRRGLNDTFFVYDEKGERYVFRLYRKGWRTYQEIEDELNLLSRLKEKVESISSPYCTKEGKLSFLVNCPEGERVGALFEFAKGEEPREFNEELSARYGRLAALVNREADELPYEGQRFDIDETHLFFEPVEEIELFLAHRSEDLDYIKRIGEPLVDLVVKKLGKDRGLWGLFTAIIMGVM